LTINFKKILIYIIYVFTFFKFFKKVRILNNVNKKQLLKINKKKNLFFKKKTTSKYFLSKRLSIVLKKRKKIKSFKRKHIDKGNFFFKKFFFKTILRNRKFLKNFFFLPKKVRQTKVTKNIFNNSKKLFLHNSSYEYSLLNIVLRSNIFPFIQDSIKVIKKGLVYVNGKQLNNFNTTISVGDCIQFIISNKIYKFMKFCRKFFKKKAAIFKFNAWKFYKQKFFSKKNKLKWKKRKNPKYLFLFFLFKLNLPKFLEVDYLTLTIFFLKKQNIFIQSSYYLSKFFSFKLFSLYNFKKIN